MTSRAIYLYDTVPRVILPPGHWTQRVVPRSGCRTPPFHSKMRCCPAQVMLLTDEGVGNRSTQPKPPHHTLTPRKSSFRTSKWKNCAFLGLRSF
jgi:hypothetical protein